ncbi:acyl-CoA thioesterase II [Phycicoccus sp. M110.8]|uniref:acyl-CoA thioesterase n=1 Tax=Phycicoccus sp. M110.8 TaxID=3075433 RepID=UPI0028FDA55A|nr:acyl-CoA thioesterase II [Phycicoccus sp. M110.8]MDU0312420.1 acyl-CoA thioesterase II [Phycicoccus sp. M110.8]HET8766863.1 acyl-CoA thioesterase II [Pedococcus sp.]
MSAQTPAELDPLDDLLQTLDLEELGTARITVEGVGDSTIDLGESGATVFLGRSQKMPHGRVFGGQVLAQCIIAAGRTMAQVDDGDGPRRIHSLHGYFMRPGDDTQPIRFAVERMRDGNSFSTRRVHAIQDGLPILSMITSFQEHAGGLDHHDAMPQVPAPDELPSLTERFGGVDHPAAKHLLRRPVELRHVQGDVFAEPGPDRVAQQDVWMKAIGRLPDDPLVHAAVLAYASDYTLLESVLRRHGLAWSDRRLRPASLDHAMWFHRPVHADEWMLYSQESPSASGGRGLGLGRIFSADGTLVATVAQEGMVRVKES